MKTVRSEQGMRFIAEENLVATRSAELRKQFQTALDEAHSGMVVLDLSSTEYIDSTGLALVIGVVKTCEKKGLPFRVEVASPLILRVFKTCKLDQLMEIKEVPSRG